jgi:hypothetical protein
VAELVACYCKAREVLVFQIAQSMLQKWPWQLQENGLLWVVSMHAQQQTDMCTAVWLMLAHNLELP